ncbi:hypothetical protein CJP74_00360 [Psittacicella melopsittaci]|uniref:Uncharacterized protein n=1 Tax=Psittacicella melopsittaci TaxID=2028576 RepID=A0A3A1YD51_9GAMM|nr:hypothetical protein [Psittacicella melopsittaci]RIY34067.1 hypothetical protein CJP74_00360 [Psittacicella melopsittaci]
MAKYKFAELFTINIKYYNYNSQAEYLERVTDIFTPHFNLADPFYYQVGKELISHPLHAGQKICLQEVQAQDIVLNYEQKAPLAFAEGIIPKDCLLKYNNTSDFVLVHINDLSLLSPEFAVIVLNNFAPLYSYEAKYAVKGSLDPATENLSVEIPGPQQQAQAVALYKEYYPFFAQILQKLKNFAFAYTQEFFATLDTDLTEQKQEKFIQKALQGHEFSWGSFERIKGELSSHVYKISLKFKKPSPEQREIFYEEFARFNRFFLKTYPLIVQEVLQTFLEFNQQLYLFANGYPQGKDLPQRLAALLPELEANWAEARAETSQVTAEGSQVTRENSQVRAETSHVTSVPRGTESQSQSKAHSHTPTGASQAHSEISYTNPELDKIIADFIKLGHTQN